MKPETPKSAEKQPQDRREYFRLDYRHPVKFRMIDDREKTVRLGTTANVSETGVLFSSTVLPKIASILWMDIDIRSLKICEEIEKRTVIYERGILGRVVRLEDDPETDSYKVGVCFITQDVSNQELKF